MDRATISTPFHSKIDQTKEDAAAHPPEGVFNQKTKEGGKKEGKTT
jgi:hypothetical protein